MLMLALFMILRHLDAHENHLFIDLLVMQEKEVEHLWKVLLITEI